jgi:hypothetical protein
LSKGNNYLIASKDFPLRLLQTKDIINGRQRGADNWQYQHQWTQKNRPLAVRLWNDKAYVIRFLVNEELWKN